MPVKGRKSAVTWFSATTCLSGYDGRFDDTTESTDD
jgi:hypothetical protein